MREPQDWRAARHQEEEGLKKKKDDDDEEEVQEVDDEKKLEKLRAATKLLTISLKQPKMLMEIGKTLLMGIHFVLTYFLIAQ